MATQMSPTKPTNPTNIFNFVPHDVTQYVLNPYLTPEDRANFNTVLEPTERIFNKLPADFAIKHSLKAFIAAQKAHVLRIEKACDDCFQLINLGITKASNKNLRSIKHYVDFISSLQARLIFQHKSKAKQSALKDLALFLDEEEVIARFIDDKLKQRIQYAMDIVYNTPFLREV